MFRKIFFWLHLLAGLIASLLIAILAFTGFVQVFEKELIAWSERDVRQIAPPSSETPRLALDELLRRARESKSDGQPSGITVFAKPTAAVAIAFGRETVYYANPYTGEIRKPNTRMSDFIRLMERIHRTLGFSDKSTAPIGKTITGAASATFLFLSLSGLYLWWPRNWTWRSVRAVTVFNLRLVGKARDFNWHNAFGFWLSPIFILITLTALPMSYRWANNLLFRATGNEPPAQGPGPGAASAITVPTPEPGAKKLGYDTLLAAAQREEPNWTEATFRLGNARGPGGQRRENRPDPNQNTEPKAADRNPSTESRPNRASDEPSERRPDAGASGQRGPQAVNIAVRTADQWPLFSTTTLTLDPFSGAILRKETFAEQNSGRRLRAWARYLHTGEALGLPGKLLAAFATLGAIVLVWTGIALSWRRFFRRKAQPHTV